MRTMIAFLFLLCFWVMLFAPCASAVDIYTFKKDRVDQELSGNRGYISGKPKNIPETRRNLKRTLIGIDVELPVEESDGEYAPGETTEKTSAEPSRSSQPVTVVGDDTEEEWIK